MLGQRRRRWANIGQTLGRCVVFAGMFYDIAQIQRCPQIEKLSLNKSLNSSDREGQINLCQIRLFFFFVKSSLIN